MVEIDLPVQVGQLVEIKTLIHGFRGAWFRCKIRKITRRAGQPYVHLEYCDFPDEKILPTKLYQRIPSADGVKSKKQQLMVRPSFPPIYRKSEKLELGVSQLAVIAEDEWKVGDRVDYWADSCYWAAHVTKILDHDKVQINLPPPPVGEGSTYIADSEELRPSLEWSPESGWTLPTIKGGGQYRHCAQLVQPANEGKPVHSNLVGTDQHPMVGGSSTALYSPKVQSTKEVTGLMLDESKTSKQDAEMEKLKSDNAIRLNSMSSDTLESAVLDFETLATRVRMLERILEHGIPK